MIKYSGNIKVGDKVAKVNFDVSRKNNSITSINRMKPKVPCTLLSAEIITPNSRK